MYPKERPEDLTLTYICKKTGCGQVIEVPRDEVQSHCVYRRVVTHDDAEYVCALCRTPAPAIAYGRGRVCACMHSAKSSIRQPLLTIRR